MNPDVVRRYFAECIPAATEHDEARLDVLLEELLTDDFAMAYNGQPDGEAGRGRADHRRFLLEHAAAYQDDRWTVEALVADEERVACWWRIEARHAPTGRPIDIHAADFYVVRGERLAELRRFLDFASLRLQTKGQR